MLRRGIEIPWEAKVAYIPSEQPVAWSARSIYLLVLPVACNPRGYQDDRRDHNAANNPTRRQSRRDCARHAFLSIVPIQGIILAQQPRVGRLLAIRRHSL